MWVQTYRVCTRCKKRKHRRFFRVKSGALLRSECMECGRSYSKEWFRQYYKNNRQTHIKRNIARRQQFRTLLQKLKHNKKCLDCKKRHPHWRLDYDHVRGKKAFSLGVAVKLGYGMERIMAEIAKCELVCSNCHRDRTWRRRKRGARKKSPL